MERIFLGLAALGCGSYTVLAAARNGFDMGMTEIDGLVMGGAFASIVIGSWFLPSLVAKTWINRSYVSSLVLSFGVVLSIAFILFNAIGYVANNVESKVGDRSEKIDRYELALQTVKAKQERIEEMKKHRRWDSTNGCVNDTVPKSIEYCDTFEKVEAELAAAQEIVNSGRPAVADPQAEKVAWVFTVAGVTTEVGFVQNLRPVFLAVVLEFMAMILTFGALNPIAKARPAPKVVKIDLESSKPSQTSSEEETQTKAAIEDHSDGKKNTRKKRKTKSGGKQLQNIPGVEMKIVDGRKLRWTRQKIANDDTCDG